MDTAFAPLSYRPIVCSGKVARKKLIIELLGGASAAINLYPAARGGGGVRDPRYRTRFA